MGMGINGTAQVIINALSGSGPDVPQAARLRAHGRAPGARIYIYIYIYIYVHVDLSILI